MHCYVKELDGCRVEAFSEECPGGADHGVCQRIADLEQKHSAIADAFAPVRDWYDGDGQRDDLAAMITDAVEDLQADRGAALELEKLTRFRLLDEYHEDFGPVLWWKLPVDEPPWCGTPNDSDWPGYQTHWTPLAKLAGNGVELCR